MRDLREYARQTQRRLILGVLILLFMVGGGLIWWFYGAGGAALGIVCLLAGLMPVALIALIFGIVDWILKRAGRE